MRGDGDVLKGDTLDLADGLACPCSLTLTGTALDKNYKVLVLSGAWRQKFVNVV